MKRILLILSMMLMTSSAFGIIEINQASYDLSAPNGSFSLSDGTQAYILTSDIIVDDSAFVLRDSPIEFDFNGFTVTYGNGNVVNITNSDFESNIAGEAPDDWTIVGGTATCELSHSFWSGDYHLEIPVVPSTTMTITQDTPVTLSTDKTYVAYMMSKGPREKIGDDYVTTEAWLNVYDASDNTLIASREQSSIALPTYMALGIAHQRTFKLSDLGYAAGTTVDVYVEVEIINPPVLEGTIILDRIAIEPSRCYAFVGASYQSTEMHPDLARQPAYDGGGFELYSNTGTGGIIQGLGNAVYSPSIAVTGTPYIHDFDININGDNTSVISGLYSGGTFERLNITHESTYGVLVFNRFAGESLMKFPSSRLAITIKDCVLIGGGCQGISLYLGTRVEDVPPLVLIEGCTIRNFQRVTNGYAIGASATQNLIIRNNIIEPTWGRGILFDTVSGYADEPKGCYGSVYGNTITVQERRNAEFGNDNLQTPGIRIREYTAGHHVLDIYDNTITAKVFDDGTSAGETVDEANCIVVTSRRVGSDILIHNNLLSSMNTAPGGEKEVHSLLFEGCNETTNADQDRYYAIYPGTANIQIYDNNVISNNVCVQFGGADGHYNWGIDFTNNQYNSYTMGLGHTQYQMYFYVGDATVGGDHYYSPVDGDVDVTTGLIVNGDINFNGEYSIGGEEVGHYAYDVGSYEYKTSYKINVLVVNSNGDPIEGATVELEDVNSNITSYTTDATGRIAEHSLSNITMGVSSVPAVIPYYPYTVTATSGAWSHFGVISNFNSTEYLEINIEDGVIDTSTPEISFVSPSIFEPLGNTSVWGTNFLSEGANSRVLLTDNSVYDSSVYVVEQDINNWIDGKIDLTVTKGLLSYGTVYCYVIDSNYVRSIGYACTLVEPESVPEYVDKNGMIMVENFKSDPFVHSRKGIFTTGETLCEVHGGNFGSEQGTAKVELVDNIIYANSTVFVEQTITGWASGGQEVIFTVDTGALDVDETAYIFVTTDGDKRNEVSIPISLDGREYYHVTWNDYASVDAMWFHHNVYSDGYSSGKYIGMLDSMRTYNEDIVMGPYVPVYGIAHSWFDLGNDSAYYAYSLANGLPSFVDDDWESADRVIDQEAWTGLYAVDGYTIVGGDGCDQPYIFHGVSGGCSQVSMINPMGYRIALASDESDYFNIVEGDTLWALEEVARAAIDMWHHSTNYQEYTGFWLDWFGWPYNSWQLAGAYGTSEKEDNRDHLDFDRDGIPYMDEMIYHGTLATSEASIWAAWNAGEGQAFTPLHDNGTPSTAYADIPLDVFMRYRYKKAVEYFYEYGDVDTNENGVIDIDERKVIVTLNGNAGSSPVIRGALSGRDLEKWRNPWAAPTVSDPRTWDEFKVKFTDHPSELRLVGGLMWDEWEYPSGWTEFGVKIDGVETSVPSTIHSIPVAMIQGGLATLNNEAGGRYLRTPVLDIDIGSPTALPVIVDKDLTIHRDFDSGYVDIRWRGDSATPPIEWQIVETNGAGGAEDVIRAEYNWSTIKEPVSTPPDTLSTSFSASEDTLYLGIESNITSMVNVEYSINEGSWLQDVYRPIITDSHMVAINTNGDDGDLVRARFSLTSGDDETNISEWYGTPGKMEALLSVTDCSTLPDTIATHLVYNELSSDVYFDVNTSLDGTIVKFYMSRAGGEWMEYTATTTGGYATFTLEDVGIHYDVMRYKFSIQLEEDSPCITMYDGGLDWRWIIIEDWKDGDTILSATPGCDDDDVSQITFGVLDIGYTNASIEMEYRVGYGLGSKNYVTEWTSISTKHLSHVETLATILGCNITSGQLWVADVQFRDITNMYEWPWHEFQNVIFP